MLVNLSKLNDGFEPLGKRAGCLTSVHELGDVVGSLIFEVLFDYKVFAFVLNIFLFERQNVVLEFVLPHLGLNSCPVRLRA